VVRQFLERAFTHSYKFERFTPPITVVSTVLTRWGPSGGFEYKAKKILSLNLVTLGLGQYRQESASGLVHPGEVFLAHRGLDQFLRTGPSGFLHKRSLLLSGDALESVMRATGLINLNCVRPAVPSAMVALFRQAHKLMKETGPGFVGELSNLAYRILTQLAESIAPEYPLEIRSAIQFMKQNLTRQVALQEIADAAQLSVRHCNRLFGRYLGRSPMTYFVEQRMALAESLVTHSDLSVKRIADQLGFEDPFHFSLMFKKQFGASPKRYRQSRSVAE
jgi:AraC-like DNA-binding protein